MDDPLNVLVALMVIAACYGIGFTAGRNHAKREWRAWLRKQVNHE